MKTRTRTSTLLLVVSLLCLGCGDTISDTTPASGFVPSAPLSPYSTAGDGQITVTWTAPSSPGAASITRYNIYRGTSSGSMVYYAYSSTPQFLDKSATNGTTFYYAITAVNSVGEGARSLPTSATAVFNASTMISVPAGTYVMGAAEGEPSDPEELPRHNVTLSAYQIGKYEVTNQRYADVMNWALTNGHLTDFNGAPYAGGTAYAGNVGMVYVYNIECHLAYSGGQFVVESKDGHSMADYPISGVTWYSAVLFCHFLSRMEGLDPVYITTGDWDRYTPLRNGYRLPTEAEWERAAAWDSSISKHWRYGFQSDTISSDRATYDGNNLIGLSTFPYLTPVGYFNGRPGTTDSQSPIGCYDMTGNVYEWVHDWYLGSYYSGGDMVDPIGNLPASFKVLRGGSEFVDSFHCRSAHRYERPGSVIIYHAGFRLARTP